MRLTLRTLLAYLDDILDPADKEELAKKVESSDFAEELIHRTRDTTRRLRLSAPQVVGTGMGLDPNTVAEYLDNVLPPDSVGDFERICLESDMHLAEAASCHHILTMVLGEPAEVEPDSRERMYTISNESDSQRRSSAAPTHGGVAGMAGDGIVTAAAAPPPSAVTQTMTLEVPDYLRASGWSATRTALVAIAAVVLVVAAVLFVPALRDRLNEDRPSEVASNANSSPQESITAVPSESTAAQGAAMAPSEPSLSVTTPAVDRSTAAIRSTPIATPSSDVPQTNVGSSPGDGMPDRANATAAPISQTVVWPNEATTTSPIPMPAAPDATGFGPATAAEPAGFPATSGASDGGFRPVENQLPPLTNGSAIPSWPGGQGEARVPSLDTSSTMPTDAGTQTAMSSARPGGTSENRAPIATSATASIPAPAEGAPIQNVGTFLGGKTVLLRFNPTMNAWFRLEPRAAVVLGDRLQSLPEFRPQVSFPAGLQMDISGGTQVVVKTADSAVGESLPMADEKTPAIEVVYGRVVFYNTTNDEQRVRLTVGTHTVDVRMAPNSPFGVEVTRSYVPGVDPRKLAAPIVANFVAPMPGITWVDRSGERPLTEPAQWQLANGQFSQPGPVAAPAPEWLVHEPSGPPSEMLAVPTVEAAITPLQPADVQLLELYEGARRREVKSLAVRASVHVGMFDPFIEALRDSSQRPNWRSQIDTLRMAMALSPESAERVWQTLVQQRGDRSATDLYEMLCGYSLGQVGATKLERQNGPLARLIAWLESDSLDYRVLAVENLYDITGKRLLQNPIDVVPGRPNAGIRNWKDRLAKDELMPTTPVGGSKQ